MKKTTAGCLYVLVAVGILLWIFIFSLDGLVGFILFLIFVLVCIPLVWLALAAIKFLFGDLFGN
jgi:hypothetical protein